jgi:predicted Zn-dependent protease
MVSMFEMLQRESALAGGGRLPEWQSTHPDPGNRIEATQRMVRESGTDFARTRIGGAEFLRRIDGLAYGTDPRLGFFQESRFVHPELAFTMLFPEGWTYRNAADAVTAISKEQDAIVELRAAKGTTSEATKAFFAQPGVQAGTESRGDVHGNFVIKSNFTAQSSGGEAVGGAVQFINFNGSTWAITAYTAANRVATQTRAFERSFASFSRLADASALAVQPFRIKISQAPRAMSLQQFNNEFPSAIPLAELAMINGMTEATMLRSGQSVKRVLGTPVPRVIVAR